MNVIDREIFGVFFIRYSARKHVSTEWVSDLKYNKFTSCRLILYQNVCEYLILSQKDFRKWEYPAFF